MKNDLKLALAPLNLSKDANNWLIVVWDIIQAFDDVVDDDKIEKSSVYALIFNCFNGFTNNIFYLQNISTLTTLLNNALMQWIAANNEENNNIRNEKTYMWRAAFYNVVLHVVLLEHGVDFATKHAHEILNIYGEEFNEYKMEGEICQTQ